MSGVKDASGTLSMSTEELLSLQRKIEHLQQENKALQIRAQGVQVLGKVLQDSQESNAKLKQEIEQLRLDLIQKGVDEAQAGLSVFTVSDDDCQSVIPSQDSSCHSSIAKSTSGIHDYVNITTLSGPQSLSAGFLTGEFHMKGVQAEFQHINCELDHLIKESHNLLEHIKKLPVDERDKELQLSKLTRLSNKLNEYAKQAQTRETLSSALVSKEEELRAKLAAMEEEQVSQENVVQGLRERLNESKEEIREIQSEVEQRRRETGVLDNEHLLIHSEQTAGALPSEESIIVKRPLLQGEHGKCEGCNQLQRQITELQRQLLTVKAEKDEALKLKEEILDVNHKWDAQYKMLAAATNKEIFDLKQQVEILSSAGSQLRNGPFQLESAGKDKRALEQRCKQLENELQRKQLEINSLQLSSRSHPGKRQPPTPQSLSMEQQPSHPSLLGAAALSTGAHTVSPTQGSPSWPGTTPHGQQIPPDVIDQIEVLKQQLRVYADDFATEREDRERNQAEKEKLREELNAVKEQVQTLEQQVQIYEEDFKREKREKEIIQQQLRSHGGGGYQYQDPLSQKARAVAEQQARVQVIREVHDRERDRLLRGQQDLQQHVYGQQSGLYPHAQSQYDRYGRGLNYANQEWQQRRDYPLVPRGSYPPRGPIAQPANQSSANSMYHGGEVLPDRVEDVVDSSEDNSNADKSLGSDKEECDVVEVEECPRCLRKFTGEDSDAILKHIERCIS